MSATKARLFGLFLMAGIGVWVLFGSATLLPKATAADPRVIFVFDNGARYIKHTGAGTWAEYKDGKLWRMHKEVSRTDKFIELYTDAPKPTETRLFISEVRWRLPGEKEWREGSVGGWKDPSKFIP